MHRKNVILYQKSISNHYWEYCIVRPKISSAALTALRLTGPQRPNESSPYPAICAPTQWEKLLIQLVPLLAKAVVFHSILNLTSFSPSPALRINHTNHILP